MKNLPLIAMKSGGKTSGGEHLLDFPSADLAFQGQQGREGRGTAKSSGGWGRDLLTMLTW